MSRIAHLAAAIALAVTGIASAPVAASALHGQTPRYAAIGMAGDSTPLAQPASADDGGSEWG